MLRTITTVLVLTLWSCTTAIIDEPDLNDLVPIERQIFYDTDISNIMFNHCTTCHSGPAASAGVSLDSYQSVRLFAEDGNLLVRINNGDNPMPPSGLISIEERQLISKWAEDGFPKN